MSGVRTLEILIVIFVVCAALVIGAWRLSKNL